ncbi:hypothetical protein OKW21_002565 [Catalinimonas alkaloidigena]|uniref:hypothetical protein n=1 Tax=Catalinimonas alkaloidigena TaxID=1075417 RepID=UPI002406AE29|nr:hypothetical protein [Catalinimonas alkaloidigena]MDF9797302.1 hypothetical protein [Catalinimonas alkaloidigena]
MDLNVAEKEKFKRLLLKWKDEGRLSPDKVEELIKSEALSESSSGSFDWKNLSFLAFFFAVMCIILATTLMITDDWLERIVNLVFDVHDGIKSLLFFVLAAFLYYLAVKRREAYPQKVFSNESLFLFGAIISAFAITYIGFSLGMYDGYYPVLILLAALIYGFVGVYLKSGVNWYLAIAAFALWFGTATTYWSGGDDLFIGMNYPMRFIFFGIILLGLYRIFRYLNWPEQFLKSTYMVGLVSFFSSLWLLSIFGNYVDLSAWREVSQLKFIFWAIALALMALGAIIYGLKYDKKMTRDIGIVFLLIDIYTRYFEYFWDSLHKVIFFIILGASFWLIGRKAEKIWNLAEKS